MSDQGPSAIVQEADCSERVLVLKLRVPGRTAHAIVGAARNGGGTGLLPHEARQRLWAGRLPPGSARQRGRDGPLVKAKLLAMTETEILFEPWSARRENPERDAGPDAGAGRWPSMVKSLRVQGGRVVVTDVAMPPGATPFIDAFEGSRGLLEARGIAVAEAVAADAIEVHRDALLRALGKAASRIERRREAIGEDLTKIAQADRIAAHAQWLVGEATRAPRGATKLVVSDWSTGTAVPLEVALDPAKSAREQVEAMFKRAKRLKLGGLIAAERLAQASGHASAVAAAAAAVRGAPSLAAMEVAARDAKRGAPRDVVLPGASAQTGATAGAKAKTATGAKAGRRVPYRSFVSRGGRKILVGKGAVDNDTLTLKIAKPHDLWLHAKDRTGAHVIVLLTKGHACPAEDLVDAAHLAAHFSDAREERAVDVQYTPKRYLRKPKGSAIGAVVVEREKVLALRCDGALLRNLLEREEI